MNKFQITFQDGTTDTLNTKREEVWALAVEQADGKHFFFSTHGTRQLAEKKRLSKMVRDLVAGTPHGNIDPDFTKKYLASPDRWVNAYVVEAQMI